MLQLCNTDFHAMLLAQPQRDAVPVQRVTSNVSFTFEKLVERQRQSVYFHHTGRNCLGCYFFLAGLCSEAVLARGVSFSRKRRAARCSS